MVPMARDSMRGRRKNVTAIDFFAFGRFHHHMTDEGPSLDDLNRFGGDTAYCPECGEEIWDQAEFCPKCRAHLGGRTSSHPPEVSHFNRLFYIAVAIIALIAFVLVFVF